jgi:hypothetical protein
MNWRVYEELVNQRQGALARIADDLDSLERLTVLVYEGGDGTQVELWGEWLDMALGRLARRLAAVRELVAQGRLPSAARGQGDAGP